MSGHAVLRDVRPLYAQFRCSRSGQVGRPFGAEQVAWPVCRRVRSPPVLSARYAVDFFCSCVERREPLRCRVCRRGGRGRARPARRAATRSLDPFVHCFDRRLFIFCTVFRIEASRSFGIRHAPTDTLGATRACQGGARQCTGQDTIGDGAAAEAGMGHWGFDSRRGGHAPRRGSRGQDHAVEAPARHARVISLAALLRVHGGKEGKEMWERY